MIKTASYSYFQSKLLAQKVTRAARDLSFEQRLDFANNINTRNSTLHHHPLLGLSKSLYLLRASILKDMGLEASHQFFDLSDAHPSFIIRNATSLDDPRFN